MFKRFFFCVLLDRYWKEKKDIFKKWHNFPHILIFHKKEWTFLDILSKKRLPYLSSIFKREKIVCGSHASIFPCIPNMRNMHFLPSLSPHFFPSFFTDTKCMLKDYLFLSGIVILLCKLSIPVVNSNIFSLSCFANLFYMISVSF